MENWKIKLSDEQFNEMKENDDELMKIINKEPFVNLIGKYPFYMILDIAYEYLEEKKNGEQNDNNKK